jgi:hypothetical protein
MKKPKRKTKTKRREPEVNHATSGKTRGRRRLLPIWSVQHLTDRAHKRFSTPSVNAWSGSSVAHRRHPTDDQQETDRYWNAIVGNGGQESACGWCKDRWGVSWQITPRVLTEALAAGGDEAKRVFGAMMGMKKIDVAAIEAARRGVADIAMLARCPKCLDLHFA